MTHTIIDVLLKVALFPLWVIYKLAERGNEWCRWFLEWEDLPNPLAEK